MQIKLLRNTAASGEDLLEGSVAEVSEQDARILIRMGKAEAHTEAPKKPAKKKA